jgi:hypothetical protein
MTSSLQYSGHTRATVLSASTDTIALQMLTAAIGRIAGAGPTRF